MPIIRAVLFIFLCFTLAYAVGISPGDPAHPTENDRPASPRTMGNMQSNDPIYEHGDEVPFDAQNYIKHVDTDQDGRVTFEEHESFFRQYILAHESDSQS